MKILWIPHTAWRIPQRANLFCRALAERHEVHVTDYAADFYSWQDYVSRRYFRNFRYRLSRDGKITVHGIPRISPALFSGPLRRWNDRLFSATVQRLIARYRIDVVVGTFVVSPPRAPRLIFDLFDDNPAYWRQTGRVPLYADEIARTESAYLHTADAVVAVSTVLADRVRSLTAIPVWYIPNGVDLARFQDANGSAWRDLWDTQGMIVGTLGNQDKMNELSKVLEAADQLSREGLTFIIAGRGAAIPEAKRQARKRGLSSVKFLERVPLQNAENLVSAFDIGLCPYHKTSGADAASPMRLLFYSAAGLPTVCTDLEEVRRMGFSNVILVEDGSRALAEGILQARNLPRRRPDQIAAYDLPKLVSQYEKVLRG